MKLFNCYFRVMRTAADALDLGIITQRYRFWWRFGLVRHTADQGGSLEFVYVIGDLMNDESPVGFWSFFNEGLMS